MSFEKVWNVFEEIQESYDMHGILKGDSTENNSHAVYYTTWIRNVRLKKY